MFLVPNLNYWFLQSLAMGITCLLLPKLRLTHPLGALFAVVALAYVNSTLWDAALFFQIPDHFTQQALLLFLANGILFWVIVKLLPGIEISGVLPALLAPVVFTVTSLVVTQYGKDIDWLKVWDKTRALIVQTRDGFEKERQPTD